MEKFHTRRIVHHPKKNENDDCTEITPKSCSQSIADCVHLVRQAKVFQSSLCSVYSKNW